MNRHSEDSASSLTDRPIRQEIPRAIDEPLPLVRSELIGGSAGLHERAGALVGDTIVTGVVMKDEKDAPPPTGSGAKNEQTIGKEAMRALSLDEKITQAIYGPRGDGRDRYVPADRDEALAMVKLRSGCVYPWLPEK